MSTRAESPSPSLEARKLLMIAAACAFLVGLDSLVVAPLIPSIAESTSVTPELGGLLVTAYALLYAISAPLFGPVSDHWGRKNIMVMGLLIFGIGTALTGVGDSFALLAVFRAVAGVGGAMIMPSMFALISEAFSYERRGRAIGLVMGALLSSTVFGLPLGSLVAYVGSWRWAFWGIGLLALIALGGLLVAIPKTSPKRDIPVSAPAAYVGQFRTARVSP